MRTELSNDGIHLVMSYSVLNEMNTKYFRQINYLFNTGNIHSKNGKIVTDFRQIFQQSNE